MPPAPKPLDAEQSELVGIIKIAHQTLAVARSTRAAEIQRREVAERLRLRQEFEKAMSEAEVQMRLDVDAEIAQHESALDEALIAAYNAGVPTRQIALQGFGNRYDGGVTALLVKLREDQRIGSKTGYQRNTAEAEPVASFPKPVDVTGMLTDATTVAQPIFALHAEPLELVPGDEEFNVTAVTLLMDARDPYFKSIEKNARKDTPYRRATQAVLYLHPATGELTVKESREEGDVIWDHPVARWVKDHPDEALAGYQSAVAE